MHPELQVHVDEPSPEVRRFTYADISQGKDADRLRDLTATLIA
jgi:hypothetical protein